MGEGKYALAHCKKCQQITGWFSIVQGCKILPFYSLKEQNFFLKMCIMPFLNPPRCSRGCCTIYSASDPFSPNHQNTCTQKPYELGTWKCERMFNSLNVSHVTLSCVTCHVSCVTCHVSHVMCKIFFVLRGGGSRWRVCYKWGLPRLVLFMLWCSTDDFSVIKTCFFCVILLTWNHVSVFFSSFCNARLLIVLCSVVRTVSAATH